MIRGGPGRDVIGGGFQGDVIFGGSGRDVLFGVEQTDRINGGPDFDVCLDWEISDVSCESTLHGWG